MIFDKKKALYNFAWIISFQFIGFCLGQITKTNMDWYNSIVKSSFTPPGFVFSITWTVLYIILALVGKSLWDKKQENQIKPILTLFIIQMILNWIWTPIFFAMHMTGLSSLIILIMLIINGYIMIKSWSKYPRITYAIIPYFLWLNFATYLNLVIWVENY
jgi:benzodiazapine receptor